MPAFGEALTDEQIAAVSRFVAQATGGSSDQGSGAAQAPRQSARGGSE
jgi:mono/diheme cytochrome c family protein